MNQNQLREYLFQKDLADQKEMDKLIRDAQPKKLNDDYKLKLYKEPIITRDLIGPEYMAEQQLLDLSIDLQLQNMVKQANYAVDGKTPDKMTSSDTEEMIADYKKEVMKPVEIGGKFHLYRPVEIPVLVAPTDKPYPHGGRRITEAEFQSTREDLIQEMSEAESELDKLHERKAYLEDKFRSGSSLPAFSLTPMYEKKRKDELDKLYKKDLEEIITKAGLPFPRPRNIPELIKTIIAHETSSLPPVVDPITKQLKMVEAGIKHYIQVYKDSEAYYKQIIGEYEVQVEIDEENRLKHLEYETKKRNLPHTALNEFNRMNQGKIEVFRQENETDNEFLARLQQLGNIFIDPADMEKQIVTEILLKAKKNILELTDNYDKAESVTRRLNNNERFQMNKAFPVIKKRYAESFGLNNKKLDDVEITQFIQNQLESSQALITGPKKSKPEYRKFDKQELLIILDQLNSDDHSLELESGTIQEMVDELLDQELWDYPKFRAIVRNNARAREVNPGLATIATPIKIPSGRQGSYMSPSGADTRFETTRETGTIATPVKREILPTPPRPREPPRPKAPPPPLGRKPAGPPPGPPPGRPSAKAPSPPLATTTSDRVLRSKAPPAKTEEKLPFGVEVMEKYDKYKKEKEPAVDDEEQDWTEPEIVEPPTKPAPKFVDSNFLGSDTAQVLKDMDAKRNAELQALVNGKGLSGHGIKNHVLPSTVPFGKIALDLNKLFYQNVLSIKRHNGNKIIGHKNKRVSDNFVDIILKMFENKPITQSDLKNIKDEQMLYDNLIVQSGLHKLKKIPTNIEQTSEQMKNRLGLITGEIEAGNSNKTLLSELHELLFKMVRVHLISKNAAAAYYKNIKDTFSLSKNVGLK